MKRALLADGTVLWFIPVSKKVNNIRLTFFKKTGFLSLYIDGKKYCSLPIRAKEFGNCIPVGNSVAAGLSTEDWNKAGINNPLAGLLWLAQEKLHADSTIIIKQTL